MITEIGRLLLISGLLYVGITAVLPLLIAYSINNWGLFTDAYQPRLADLQEAIRE